MCVIAREEAGHACRTELSQIAGGDLAEIGFAEVVFDHGA